MLEITKTIQISAPAKQVFDALTIPEQVKSYFPIDSVKSDGRVGGQFIIHGHVDGLPFTDFGTIDRFESGKEFQYTYWSTNHGTDHNPENSITIRYLLREIDGQTHLELHHHNLLNEDHLNIMLGAWDFLLGNLKTYAESA